MKFLAATSMAVSALRAATLDSASAHSYLTKPVARDKGPRTDIDNSVGCPSNNKGQVTSYKAGEEIDVRYWRNNHLGGFIRWAIAPAGQETKATFDKSAFFYTCRESGPTCLPKGQNSRYSGDNSGDYTISCGDTITLPDWLPAGNYVLQWMWFGVGSSYGNVGWAEPQFKSCADIKLTTSGSKPKPSCPTFVGGDRVTKLENKGSDVCFYFHSTEIAKAWYKGDNSKAKEDYKFGMPADVDKCSGGAAPGNGTDTSSAGDADDETAGDNDSPGSTSAPSTTPAPSQSSSKPSPTPIPSPIPSSATPKPNDTLAPEATSSKCGVKRSY